MERARSQWRKTIIVTVFIVFLPAMLAAMTATTDDNIVVCFTKENMEDMTSFIGAKDRQNFDSYIAQKKCAILKGGLDVTVLESPGVFWENSRFCLSWN